MAAFEAEARFAALAAQIIMAIYDEAEPAPVCAITLHLRILAHGPEIGLCLAGSWVIIGYAQETSVYARNVRVELAPNRAVSWAETKPDPGLVAAVLPFLEPLAGLLRQLPPADGLPATLPGLSI